MLRIYGTVISFSFATLVEQAVAVMERYLAEAGVSIAEPVAKLAEYLRYGVPVPHARLLMAAGVRHRRAALLLGSHPAMTDAQNVLREPRDVARELITARDEWIALLGPFVFDRTVADLREEPEPERDLG